MAGPGEHATVAGRKSEARPGGRTTVGTDRTGRDNTGQDGTDRTGREESGLGNVDRLSHAGPVMGETPAIYLAGMLCVRVRYLRLGLTPWVTVRVRSYLVSSRAGRGNPNRGVPSTVVSAGSSRGDTWAAAPPL